MTFPPLRVLSARAAVILATGLLLSAGLVGTASAADHPAIVNAAGQQQWISCAGKGSPTVVIASGLGADHRMWRKVLAPLRERTRVCITDRPGLGSSPARQGLRTTDAGEHADELAAALTAAGEAGPYLLVGHSYAGLIVRAFAAAHPGEVAGVLLLDAVWPGIHRDFGSSYASPWHEGGTRIDMGASARATSGGPNLGDLPLIVIAAGDPAKTTSARGRQWNREQGNAAKLSSVGQLWFAKRAGHKIQLDQPSIVITAVDQLLAAARSRQTESP